MVLRTFLYHALGIIISVVVVVGVVGTIFATFAEFLSAIKDIRTERERRRHFIIFLSCWICLGLSVVGLIAYSILSSLGIDINEWSKGLLLP